MSQDDSLMGALDAVNRAMGITREDVEEAVKQLRLMSKQVARIALLKALWALAADDLDTAQGCLGAAALAIDKYILARV